MTDKINIPDVEYRLSGNNSCHCGDKGDDVIFIGIPNNYNETLTEDELLECLGDSITHEYIHHILNHLFPYEVSFLFDAIADSLRLHDELLRELIRQNNPGAELWSDYIKRDGLKGLLDWYSQLDRDKIDKILKEGI